MYERLLDKTLDPSAVDLAVWCGGNRQRFEALNASLSARFGTVQQLRFPYGKQYGWCITHRLGKKLVCDVFAEADAFTVMLRLNDAQFAAVYGEVSAYTKAYIDHRYPCGDGGWIHYRVTDDAHYNDIMTLLNIKCAKER